MIKGLQTQMTMVFRSLLFGLLLSMAGLSVAAETAQTNELKGIDFRVNKNKDAVLIVELASPSTVVNVQKVADGLQIELLKTDVSNEKLYVLDVKDFATVVESIEVLRKEPSTQLLATIHGEFIRGRHAS